MLLYSVILILVAAILFILAVLIYKGRTELIHSYHRTNVKDKKGYGRAMGKALMILALTLLVAGVITLFGESDAFVLVSLAVMFVGMAASFVALYKVQKKYNGGMFGDFL